ncbi:MAG: hypothetical protein U0V56_13070 [Actinomycetota bacterium]
MDPPADPRGDRVRPVGRYGGTPAKEAGEIVGSFPSRERLAAVLALALLALGAALLYGAILVPLGAALVAFAVLGMMRESRD